jgi:hydroxypyruvate isomerase
MKRRKFIWSMPLLLAASDSLNRMASGNQAGFRLNYAPHFGMFKSHAGEDLVDQLEFIADEGFSAIEDNNMMDRPVEIQEKLAAAMSRLGIKMGVFVAYAQFASATFVKKPAVVKMNLIREMKKAVDVARRLNAKWCTVVPGAFDPGVQWDYQTANVIDNLKYCADELEPHGITMVLEPLNPWRDHPGLFLTHIPQAYQICKAVDSPSCKILNDLYHQQITEGNLIPNIDHAWSEIAYFQVGDNPGRKEPTTGEINYLNIFKHLHSREYKGIIGMEHGNSREGKKGERAVIDAYRYCDSF